MSEDYEQDRQFAHNLFPLSLKGLDAPPSTTLPQPPNPRAWSTSSLPRLDEDVPFRPSISSPHCFPQSLPPIPAWGQERPNLLHMGFHSTITDKSYPINAPSNHQNKLNHYEALAPNGHGERYFDENPSDRFRSDYEISFHQNSTLNDRWNANYHDESDSSEGHESPDEYPGHPSYMEEEKTVQDQEISAVSRQVLDSHENHTSDKPDPSKGDECQLKDSNINTDIAPSPIPTAKKHDAPPAREEAPEPEDDDPLAALAEPRFEELLNKNVGQICELLAFDDRLNTRGERVLLQVGSLNSFDIDEERGEDMALSLIRRYDATKTLESTRLLINSPYIKGALREVVRCYPGVNFDSIGPVTISDEPRCLFHYRQELRAYAEMTSDPISKEHVDFCLKYMNKTLQREIEAYKSMMEKSETAPGLEFDNLWMAFKPGDLLYERLDGVERVFRLRSMRRQKFTNTSGYIRDYWRIHGEQIQYDGIFFGHEEEIAFIRHYNGYKPLHELQCFPLQYHNEKDRIKEELILRGRKFVSLTEIHYRHFTGAAKLFSRDASEKDDYQTISISNRVIIDPTEFNVNIQPLAIEFIQGEKTFIVKKDEHLEMSDNELLICGHEMPGYSLVDKKWGYFDVRHIQEIEFNIGAFDSLVLSQQKKFLISTLVKEQSNKDANFDDLIKGKGKGLIFLLHGEPGTGKTLTAESIADHTQRPLFVIGCGDLGASASRVENQLTSALDLATKWNAIVLVDEADVFMEQRSNNELQRNELVSVLLRILEYFEGIMFLTTNRIGSIDAAFKSRIHLSISYPPLTPDARRQIWKNFAIQGSPERHPPWFNDEFLDQVSKEAINGRQIKNLVRMASAAAANEKREVEPADILLGLAALKDFENEFTEATDQRRREDGRRRGFVSLGQPSLPSPSIVCACALGLVFTGFLAKHAIRRQ